MTRKWSRRRYVGPKLLAELHMNLAKLLGIVLIVAGVLGLVYGGFSFTRESHEVKIGSLELSMKEKQSVSIPTWVGVAAIAVGGALLLFGGRKR